MCKFNWYILLLRFIFIHVSYFIMHGVKSHSFDNFPSFCFSFSSCPLLVELAKNIGNAPGGDGSLVQPTLGPQILDKGSWVQTQCSCQVIVWLLSFNGKQCGLCRWPKCYHVLNSFFPSKTWFFGIYFNFQQQKSLKNQYLPHSESKYYQINSITSC